MDKHNLFTIIRKLTKKSKTVKNYHYITLGPINLRSVCDILKMFIIVSQLFTINTLTVHFLPKKHNDKMINTHCINTHRVNTQCETTHSDAQIARQNTAKKKNKKRWHSV